MENGIQEQEEVVTQVEEKSKLHQVTPLSKYLAMALFIILPFVGGYIGYTYAPDKLVEVERVVIQEVYIESPVEVVENSPSNTTQNAEIVSEFLGWSVKLTGEDSFSAKNDSTTITMKYPVGWLVGVSQDNPPTDNKSVSFTNPNRSGVSDTDIPIESIRVSSTVYKTSCSEIEIYDQNLLPNDTLSSLASGVSVYDSGWVEGWGDLPTRELCYDADGDLLLVTFAPIEMTVNDINTIIETVTIE